MSLGLLALACSLGDLDGLKSGTTGDAAAGNAGASSGGTAGQGGGGLAGAGQAGGGGKTGTFEDGSPCSVPNDCLSGYCVDSVCCDTACSGTCLSCVAGAKESGTDNGVCGPSKSGTDPQGQCTASSPDSCGDDGQCDGKGACRKFDNTTECAPATCTSGVKTLPSLCDGKGVCQKNAKVTCSPKQCKGNVCSGDCTSDAACQTGEYCELGSGKCLQKKAQGSSCKGKNQCSSGYCVDGFCCESACTGKCKACSATLSVGQNGKCAAVTGGTDPGGECSDQGASSCGTDGQCDGKGACRKYGPTAVCGASSCSGSTQTNTKTCDGAGNCKSNGTVSCSPYVCGTSTCRTSCSSASHCVSGSYCSGNKCQGKKSNGQSCGSASECTSNYCVDGVCCNSSCTGICKACSASKKGTGVSGTCGNVASGQDPDGNCSAEAASTCKKDGSCNGAGACRLWKSGTVCKAAQCLANTGGAGFSEHYADTCDGSGNCVDKGIKSCGLYNCGIVKCKTSCSSTADCWLGTCVTSTGTCNFGGFGGFLPR